MKRNATPDGGNMESAEPATTAPVAVVDPVVKIANGARIQAAANMAMTTTSQGVRKRKTGIASMVRNTADPAGNTPLPRMP